MALDAHSADMTAADSSGPKPLLTLQLTWDTQTPVAVAHAAADPMGAGVQGTEVHQLGTRGAGEARCAATAEPQRAGALGVACPVIVTGAGGTRVHLLLACSTLVACERGKTWTRVGNGRPGKEREKIIKSLASPT